MYDYLSLHPRHKAMKKSVSTILRAPFSLIGRCANFSKPYSSSAVNFSVSAFVLLFANYRFAANVLGVYPLSAANIPFFISLALILFCVNIILLSVVTIKFMTKPALILFLLLSAFAAYFMDTYNVIIDDVMIDNIVRTDRAEVTNLISLKQILYVIFLGLIPSFIVLKLKLNRPATKQAIWSRLKLFAGALTVIIVLLISFGSAYATFFREHKLLRFYTNPTYLVYSLVRYVSDKTASVTAGEIGKIALDARIDAESDKKKLIVIVVGETVRADHMSLNGYARDTNPYLETEDIINFSNVWSCGTSTAVSVPCMFSSYSREDFNGVKADSTENVLDILARLGINVIWLDNNSDSKGVALRIPYESFKSSETNSECDDECHDIGMLTYLESFVEQNDNGDIVVVLHQMGNHGPAYYKRYPPEFEKFTPACKTNILENCSDTEIINSYDNAILYTDYFLKETIAMLKTHSDEFSTAMMYISDHGESLGEYGVYLHGLPYSLAPDTQKHVPLIMWFSDSFRAEQLPNASLDDTYEAEYSHDNIFHTILGLTDISTDLYDEKLDLTRAL